MKNYLETLQTILDNGVEKGDRTGTGTISLFSPKPFEHDMRNGFPLLTTKKVFFRGVVEELLWFLSGSSNIKPLIDKDVKIWDGNGYDYYHKSLRKTNKAMGTEHKELSFDTWKERIKNSLVPEPGIGDLGRIYGVQWRDYGQTSLLDGYDQVRGVVNSLRDNPNGRRHIINAWNGKDIAEGKMALPPCHMSYQFYVEGDCLHMMMYQRSADMFLGVPFNIASSALLQTLVAREVGLVPARLIINYGDAHIYSDHVEQCRVLLGREPLRLPKIRITGKSDLFNVKSEQIELIGYKHQGSLPGKMSV